MGAVEHGITITAKYKYTKMFYKPEGFGEVKHVKFHFLRFWSSCLQEVILYKNDKRQIHCALLMAKSRVTPLKAVTIPRLELAIAVTCQKRENMKM